MTATTTTTEGDEEDTTLADIEGRMNEKISHCIHSIADGVEEDIGANNIKLMMDVFVNQLPQCVNREMIDKVKLEKFFVRKKNSS